MVHNRNRSIMRGFSLLGEFIIGGSTVHTYRCDHSCTVTGENVMNLCGGNAGDEVWFNDLHRLGLDSLQWTEVEQRGNPPLPRDYSTLVTIDDWVSHLSHQ